jgi:hypothetical protein
MSARHIQHSLLTHDRPLRRFLWLLLWISIWVVGFALSELIIENLYFR